MGLAPGLGGTWGYLYVSGGSLPDTLHPLCGVILVSQGLLHKHGKFQAQ